MEARLYVKKIVITAIILIVCFLLQVSFFPYIKLASVVPNILLIVACTYGFLRGSNTGMLVGAISGLMLDLFSGQYFGFYCLLYLLVGFLCGLFRSFFYGDDLKLPLLMIGACDIIFGTIIFIFRFLFRGNINFFHYFKIIILPEAVYTVMVAVILYYILLRINVAIEEEENRRSRRLG